MNRTSGILLHPTSLPGPFGIGDLGPQARSFVDWLAEAGQGLWQVLPLGPTGFGDSPYQCLSAFAGNPLLLSPQLLVEEGWLEESWLTDAPVFPKERVDYGRVMGWKRTLIEAAYQGFRDRAGAGERNAFALFTAQQPWLEDYCLYLALKEYHHGAPWIDWPEPLRRRDPEVLAHWRAELGQPIALQQFAQYQFFHQWTALRQYAHSQGVRIVGDVPIFVAHDCADLWSHPQWFQLDEAGRMTAVAGVPPDYFSATGQRWGNPLYRWEVLARDGYRFWVERLRTVLSLVDWARLDHFRGFAANWEIPAAHQTAEHGRWVAGPGLDLFEALRRELDGLPLIAEDLGLITWDVEALRKALELPGMAVLQFAFGADIDGTGQGPRIRGDSPYLPHNHARNTVVYTGTHDNDTTLGWWESAPASERELALDYLDARDRPINWAMIRAALASRADWALIPLQDVLDLGCEGRLNTPGQGWGNWNWRYQTEQLTQERAQRLGHLAGLYGRRAAPRMPL